MGVSIGSTQNVVFDNVRAGYELNHDGVVEVNMQEAFNGFNVGASAQNVTFNGCYVAQLTGSNIAYARVGSSAQGNRITNASGNKSFSGFWQSDLDTINATDRGDNSISLAHGTDYVIQQFKTALTANRTVTINPGTEVKGSRLRIVRTGLGGFTLRLVAPAGGPIGVIPASTKGWGRGRVRRLAVGARRVGYHVLTGAALKRQGTAPRPTGEGHRERQHHGAGLSKLLRVQDRHGHVPSFRVDRARSANRRRRDV